MVTSASGRVDHLYLHLRNRIDRITENMDEMSLYDSIATASPAAGFFGTLTGFLYIFSQGQSAANLSQSLEFASGPKGCHHHQSLGASKSRHGNRLPPISRGE